MWVEATWHSPPGHSAPATHRPAGIPSRTINGLIAHLSQFALRISSDPFGSFSSRFGDHMGRFEAAEFIPSLIRAHITARELASPPFEVVYIRACTNPGHPGSASNMTTWVNSQFPRPDFHRQVQRHYGLQNRPRSRAALVVERDRPAKDPRAGG